MSADIFVVGLKQERDGYATRRFLVETQLGVPPSAELLKRAVEIGTDQFYFGARWSAENHNLLILYRD